MRHSPLWVSTLKFNQARLWRHTSQTGHCAPGDLRTPSSPHRAVHPRGSTALPPTYMPQCRWGPVESPVDPTEPSTWPFCTRRAPASLKHIAVSHPCARASCLCHSPPPSLPQPQMPRLDACTESPRPGHGRAPLCCPPQRSRPAPAQPAPPFLPAESTVRSLRRWCTCDPAHAR